MLKRILYVYVFNYLPRSYWKNGTKESAEEAVKGYADSTNGVVFIDSDKDEAEWDAIKEGTLSA